MKKNMLLVFLVLIFSLSLYDCKSKTDSNEGYGSKFEKEKITVKIGNKEKELRFSFNKISASNEERVLKKIKMNSKFKIGGIDDETFISPANIKVDSNENIYVLDCRDCSVKKFDEDGRFIKKYGEKGKGPGEFTYAFYFDVFND